MPPLDTAVVVLAGIASVAAFLKWCPRLWVFPTHRAAGSRFYTNRTLNPAVVLVEVVVNFYVLFINLNGVAAVWKRVWAATRVVPHQLPRRQSVYLDG